MSEILSRYQSNCKKSKALCEEMERLIALSKACKANLKYLAYEEAQAKLIKVQDQLIALWDEQIQLSQA